MISATNARIITESHRDRINKLNEHLDKINECVTKAANAGVSYAQYPISLNSLEEKAFIEYFKNLGYQVVYDWADCGNYQVSYFLEFRW